MENRINMDDEMGYPIISGNFHLVGPSLEWIINYWRFRWQLSRWSLAICRRSSGWWVCCWCCWCCWAPFQPNSWSMTTSNCCTSWFWAKQHDMTRAAQNGVGQRAHQIDGHIKDRKPSILGDKSFWSFWDSIFGLACFFLLDSTFFPAFATIV